MDIEKAGFEQDDMEALEPYVITEAEVNEFLRSQNSRSWSIMHIFTYLIIAFMLVAFVLSLGGKLWDAANKIKSANMRNMQNTEEVYNEAISPGMMLYICI